MSIHSDCVNLTERFGDRFKIGWDDAFDPKHRPKDKLDPWMMLLEFQGGNIYPQGGDMLAVEVEGRCRLRKKLDALACTILKQDGDQFRSWRFHVDDFEQVAEIVKPRKRRRISEEQRAASSVRLKRYQFVSASQGSKSDQESPPVPVDVVESSLGDRRLQGRLWID